MNTTQILYLHRDKDGTYMEYGTDEVMYLTLQQLAAIAALDAGASGQVLEVGTDAFVIGGVGRRWVAFKWFSNSTRWDDMHELVWVYQLWV